MLISIIYGGFQLGCLILSLVCLDVEDTHHKTAFLDGGAVLNLPLFCLQGISAILRGFEYGGLVFTNLFNVFNEIDGIIDLHCCRPAFIDVSKLLGNSFITGRETYRYFACRVMLTHFCQIRCQMPEFFL